MLVPLGWLQTGVGYTVTAHVASESLGVEEPATSLKITFRGLCHARALPNAPVLFSRPALSGSAACTC